MQSVFGEACAHFAGVSESTLIVVAEEKGAELDPRAARGGEAADDELLLGRALELEPVARAITGVGSVGSLSDQPFPAASTGFGVEGLPIPVPVGRVADWAGEAE